MPKPEITPWPRNSNNKPPANPGRFISFNAVDQLKAHVDAFITAYNETAKPFVWTKSNVHQKRSNLVSRNHDYPY